MPLVAARAVIVASFIAGRCFLVHRRLALAGAALAGLQRMALVGQAILARRRRDMVGLDAIGGMFVAQLAGKILQMTGSYVVLFIIAGSMYLTALAVIHMLAPRLDPVNIE